MQITSRPIRGLVNEAPGRLNGLFNSPTPTSKRAWASHKSFTPRDGCNDDIGAGGADAMRRPTAMQAAQQRHPHDYHRRAPVMPRQSGQKRPTARGNFVQAHVASDVSRRMACQMTRRGGGAINSRTTRHPGYAVSQTERKHIQTCLVGDQAWSRMPARPICIAAPPVMESLTD
jgi:hypothetical protein